MCDCVTSPYLIEARLSTDAVLIVIGWVQDAKRAAQVLNLLREHRHQTCARTEQED